MDIQAVAFDMDDTLLRSDRSISDYTVRVLRRCRERGIHVIPASGRLMAAMQPYVDRIGCASAVIGGNGSEIYRADAQLLHSCRLSAVDAQAVIRFAREHHCYVHIFQGDVFCYDLPGDQADMYTRLSGLRGMQVPDLLTFATQPTPKALLIGEPERIAQLQPLAQQTLGSHVTAVCSKPYLLEIFPSEAGKGQALRWLSGHLGFSLDKLVCFGDSMNDLTMLETAGHPVLVANARPELKALFPTHCPANDDDGVARYLDEHILQEVHA